MAKKVTTRRNPRETAGKKSQSPGRRYWLLKSEPSCFSIGDLANASDQTTFWDGVRNYQARNTMRDDMQVGDLVLFYHSNAKPPGIAGTAKVVQAGYPDHTAFDASDKHYDPKSKKGAPTWYMVDIQLVTQFDAELSLQSLKEIPELEGMVLLQKGSRLSVQPVSVEHFSTITKLAKKKRA